MGREGIVDRINRIERQTVDLVNKLFYGCKRIDLLEFFQKNTVLEFETVIKNLKNVSYIPSIVDIVKVYIEKLNQDNNEGAEMKYTLPRRFFDRLTLDQMNQLLREVPEFSKNLAFVKDILIKQFEIDPNDGISGLDFDCDNRRGNVAKMREILAWCDQNLDISMHTVNATLRFKIMEELLRLEEFDFGLFEQYLEFPYSLNNTLFDSQYLKRFKKGGDLVHH